MNFKGISLSKLLSVLSILISSMVFSQSSGMVIGKVFSPEKQPLELVSVAMLNPTDSTLVNFTTTDENGVFKINQESKDSILLQLHSTGYQSYFKHIKYKKDVIDLKIITLKEDTKMLDEIVITAVVPVQIKKDTIGFNASSFKVDHDDTIEQLLNKLPGIETQSDGKVIAQGNEITKIFVDGKEFFGGDPSIVLKNLSADAIAKVEVIDKKSDEAELTGVSDGNKEVIINLVLKKGKTQNGFGKLSGGVGLDSRYFGNLNYNKFSSKKQMSFISKYNNINVTGSNIQGFLDNANGLADESDDGDDNDFAKPLNDLSGYLKTGVAGVNYGEEIKKNESFNVDYFYNLSENKGTSKTKRVNFGGANKFENNYVNDYRNISDNHNLNFNYKNKSNKMHSLLIKGQLTSDKRNSNLDRNTSYFNTSDELTTTNNFESENINNKNSGNFMLTYIQRLYKRGRSFKLDFKTRVDNLSKDTDQSTLNNRKLNTDNPTIRNLLTLKDESNNLATFDFKFKYTEPLSTHHYLNVESFVTIKNIKENTNQSREIITDASALDEILYRYNFRENSYSTKLSHSYNTGKLNIATGLESQNLIRSFGQVEENPIVKDRMFFNPSFFLMYKPKTGRKYRLSYNKSVRSPNATQSNTFLNDLNPYSIRVGNPDLKPEKTDNILLTANVFDFKSSTNFYARVQYQNAQHAIISVINTDEDYIKTRTYENNGNREKFKTSVSFGQKIKGMGLRYTVKNSNQFSNSNALVNLQINEVTAESYMLSLDLENYNKNIFDVKIGANYSLNNTHFSIVSDLDRQFSKQLYYTMLDIDFTKKLNFNTQFDYIIYADDKFSDNQEIPLLNASTSYAFSKNNNIVKLLLIDLLNKNVNISRKSTQNYFEETISESLGRYVILSYTYKLNGGKKVKKPKIG